MAAKALWRIKAARDAEAIPDSVGEQSLDAMARFLVQTEATLAYLAEFPGMGGKCRRIFPSIPWHRRLGAPRLLMWLQPSFQVGKGVEIEQGFAELLEALGR